MGFWDELENEIEGEDLSVLAAEAGSGNFFNKAKDVYARIKDWKFDKSSQKGTPGCMCIAEVIAPCDGEDMEDVGKTFKLNFWLSKAALPFSIKNMMIASGSEIKTKEDIQQAQLDENIFKLVNNKIEPYNGEDRFQPGFVNPMTKADYQILKELGVEADENFEDQF